MAQPFLDPLQVLRLAPLGQISRAEIPGPAGRGTIGVVTVSQTGSGAIAIIGFPVGAVDFVVRVRTGGEIGTAELEVSEDGGTSFGDPILTELNDTFNTRFSYEIGDTGITLLVTDGVTPPSFVTGDTWTFSTTASPLILQHIAAAEAIWLKWAQNTAQRIDAIDPGDQQFIAQIVRVNLVACRGKVEPDWWTLYHEAMKHFALESTNDIRLNSTPNPDVFVFPDRERVRPPFGSFWRH